MSDLFDPAPGNAHIDSEGHQTGTPWPLRPTTPPTQEIDCSVCRSLKPWHLYDRKTGRGICSSCYENGARFGEKEG